jgi:glycerol-3-phosphate dehydrogenase
VNPGICGGRPEIEQHYQLLIIGGGIYGATLAWEAAHRGVDVLLAEACDFASGSSGNSLKIIHGGVRYLQQFDLGRSRRSANERRTMLGIAPHLVQPLACTLPASNNITSGRLAVAAGMTLYNALTIDRNRGVGDSHKLPLARTVPEADLNQALRPLAEPGASGGALWYDAQAWHTERLVLAFLRSAANSGAAICNYLEATATQVDAGHLGAVELLDHARNTSFTVTADAVVDCSSGGQFFPHSLDQRTPLCRYARGINLVIEGRLLEHGMGVRAQGKEAQNRLLFLTPWRDCTLAGTWYLPWDGGKPAITEEEITGFINQLNSAFQQPLITREQIVDLHIGVLPLATAPQTGDLDRQLLKHNQRLDLASAGVGGAYILRGTKYTMARAAAQQTLTCLAHKYRWAASRSHSALRTIDGGDIGSVDAQIHNLQTTIDAPLSLQSARQLVCHFGSNAATVLAMGRHVSGAIECIPGTDMPIGAIDYAVAHEWATSLSDLLLRRLELRKAGRLQAATLQYCASRMADLLGWDTLEQARQIESVAQPQKVINAPQ